MSRVREDFMISCECSGQSHGRWCWFGNNFTISYRWFDLFRGSFPRDVPVHHPGLREGWLFSSGALDFFYECLSYPSYFFAILFSLFGEIFVSFTELSTGFARDGCFAARLFHETSCAFVIFVATSLASFLDCLPIFAKESYRSMKMTIFASFYDLWGIFGLWPTNTSLLGSYCDGLGNLLPRTCCTAWIDLKSFCWGFWGDQNVSQLAGNLLWC